MSSKRSRRHAPPSPSPRPHQKHAKYEHRDTPTGSESHHVPPPGRQLSLRLIPAEVIDEQDIDGKLMLIHRFVGDYINSQGSGGKIFAGWEQFKVIAQRQQPQFLGLVSKATGPGANDDDREALLQHDTFWVASSSSRPEADERIASRESQGQAVERSWTADFVGKGPLRALEKHVRVQMTMGKRYARYCSIVQSSGMGKSRLLDEFSKEHFLIPINLRPKDGEGFPPADDGVREFLTSNQEYQGKSRSESSFIRAHYFLKALFCVTAETITKLDADYTPSEGGAKRTYRIDKFREFMSNGQTMGSSGIQRVNFYGEVVDKATKGILRDTKSNKSKPGNKDRSRQSKPGDKSKLDEKKLDKHDKNLIDAFESLRSRINDDSLSMEELRLPDVFLVFDEAHPLTTPFESEGTQSNFVELRRALRVLSDVSLFTFFLSTTGKISQFSPPRGRDASHRMNDGELKTPTPFIYLGFDQLMKNHKVFDKWGTSYDHGDDQVRRGLVHFASLKLLCGTFPDKLSEAQNRAVLSQRLPLDINSTIYVPLPSDQVEKEQEQISNHMRVCMSIEDGIDTIRGIAASEPILAEAASVVMSDSRVFNLVDALSEVLTGFGINTGDRAELLVAAFFTWARDITAAKLNSKFSGQLSRYFSVADLFSSLFSEATYTSMSGGMPSLCHARPAQMFGQVFGNAWMHFNHFIKPHQRKVLTRPYLLAFMARGAAAFGATGQRGFDAVYPFLYGGTDLDVDKVGFIIVQVKKNDTSEVAQAQIFKKMDPFACGLLSLDKLERRFPIPIIRIVFALCSSKASGVTHKTYSSPAMGASYVDENGQPYFTTYDFWCSGIHKDFLNPVKDFPDKWIAMANKADSWRSFYNNSLDPSVLRSQTPGSGLDPSHFDSWSTLISGSEDLF
ncbi:hypothetical protein EDB85DRAFT_1891783 [Lactarius pseudohatsudake]|nr:hypothetical protein EDB85DRAFT_1891783 [Lactarius pseudohatsudake]